ncbi:iron ABC transporter [Geobacillus sp. T6]|uniref:FecCD family ABC transporter permease n=1 Tax=Geobacillus TaxID=129337 RepID=UPI00064A912D|nr:MULTISPECIES: iron ABC transporter permease [Geobacillus]ASS98436.1 iron ABC transporter [Geobacillus thermocatenulatus]KLR74141.1 iron ABC transporter [Geobacillus sp. T6]
MSSLTYGKKAIWISVIVGLGIVLLMIVSLVSGPFFVPIPKVLDVLLHDDGSKARTVVWNLRFPRALLAVLIGANLAVAGAMMQCLTKNPMAEPKIMGVSAGAAAMVVLIEYFFAGLPLLFFSPLVFLGAAVGGALVYSLSLKRGTLSPVRLTLAGVAVSAFLHAITVGILVLLGQDAAAVYAWLAGGLNGLTWRHVSLIAPWSLAGLLLSIMIASKMDLLELGDDTAKGLGVHVGILKTVMAVMIIILAGSAVSVSGVIGFIGLIIPHIVRKMVGVNYTYIVPVSALCGGMLLLTADLLARLVAQPIELPVGVFTAAIGCPYFLYLIRKQGEWNA